MYGLLTSAEALARHFVIQLAKNDGVPPEDWLQDFALRYAQLPPNEGK